ncbi:unnamed protein product [Prunus armeniaca]
MVVIVSAALPIAEGVLVAILPLGVLGVGAKASGGSSKVLRDEVPMDKIAEVEFTKTTFESFVSSPVICLWAAGIFVVEAGGIFPKGFVLTLSKHIQIVCGV